MNTSDLTARLRANGHRVTSPRRAVFETLLDATEHLTVEDVAARATSRHPGVNLSSVYRSLDLLAELGLARETRFGDEDAARWELAHPDEHFHLVCQGCGAVDHHAGELVAQIIDHLAGGHHFQAHTVDLTVTGLCQACS